MEKAVVVYGKGRTLSVYFFFTRVGTGRNEIVSVSNH
jgi:hypothetical protein